MEANETNNMDETEPVKLDKTERVNLDKAERVNLDETAVAATPAPRVDQADSPIQDTISPPARPKGPNVAPVVLGVVALVLAALVIAEETMKLTVNWSRLGPAAVITIGVVMVLFGAVGLVRRHDDV
jgi:hypothetical protein